MDTEDTGLNVCCRCNQSCICFSQQLLHCQCFIW